MKTLHETNARKNHQQVSLVQQLVHTSIKREVDWDRRQTALVYEQCA